MTRIALHSIPLLGLALVLFTGLQPAARAGENTGNAPDSGTITAQGSRDTHRVEIDAFYAEVYIYVGGSLPAGTDLTELQFLFDQGSASGYITPILFEQSSPGIFAVRGIGTGVQVSRSSASQTIPFGIVEGRRITDNASYTFGFINAIVNVSGAPVLTSPGVVDYVSPANDHHGVGGPETTNSWGATETGLTPIVALGTTFGAAGTEYPFTLPYRTYSAFALGFVTGQ